MAVSRHHIASSRPLNVEEIVRQAQNFEFIPNRSLKGWLRSTQMLLTEAAICEQDGDLQKAYLYLYRHAELVIRKLPQHPDYKHSKYKADLAQAQRTVQKNLAKLEQWQPKINHEHQRFVMAKDRRDAERKRLQGQRINEVKPRVTNEDTRRDSLESEDDTVDDPDQALNATENRQLAVDLAHQEIRRRDAAKQSTRRAGISPSIVAARRRGFVSEIYDDHEFGARQPQGSDGVSEGIREAGRHLRQASLQAAHRDSAPQRSMAAASYQYPSVPSKEGTMDWNMAALQPTTRPTPSRPPPSLPAKEYFSDRAQRLGQSTPLMPPKPQSSASPSPATATPSPPPLIESPRSKYTFKSTSFTEAGVSLRTVFLPPDLRSTFLNLAHPNTLRNLETCGILCGTLISNALFINHLIIPDQSSTSDTCDTTEEGDNALFDFCDSHDLLVCGWIHTHPSQTCFLSSRDLHTSSGYQVMLPEAIAIVCAPRHNPDWGIFRLTDPPGLSHVLKCDQRGLFHPHSEHNLYTDALRPGHVVEGPGLKYEVVDLRK